MIARRMGDGALAQGALGLGVGGAAGVGGKILPFWGGLAYH